MSALPPGAAQAAAAFAAAASADLPEVAGIESRAVATTGSAIEDGKVAVTVYVSAADGDRERAGELIDALAKLCQPSSRYAYTLWHRGRVQPGEDLSAESERARARSAVALVLISPQSLPDQTCGADVRRFREMPGSPLLPVVLEPVSERHDLGALAGLQLFWPGERAFAGCRGRERAAFVTALFECLERRLDDLLRARDGSDRREAYLRAARDLVGEREDAYVEQGLSGTSLAAGDFEPEALARLSTRSEPALEALERWALDRDGPLFAAVLAEYGIGKTTTLKQLTRRLLERREADPQVPLPIFIDLRTYSESVRGGRVPDLTTFLDEVLARSWKMLGGAAFDAAIILRLVREEGALLIFDGLDEKLVHLDEVQGGELLRQLWSALPAHLFRPGAPATAAGRGRPGKLLFSCRSHLFTTVREQGAFLRGQDRDGVRASDYRAFILLPFTEAQVRQYLGQVLGSAERVDAALALFKAVHNLEELAPRPYLLSLMAPRIAALEARRAGGETVLGVTLYETVVEEWLNRDDGKHYVHKEDKRRLMADLAAELWRDGAREWSWERVRRWLGKRVAGDDVLRARYLGGTGGGRNLDRDFATATFILRPDTSAEDFRFAHTSLQEYFLACHLRRCLDEGEPEGWELPMPSDEALDFLGQLLALERRPAARERAARALAELLAHRRPRASEAAFRYRLRAEAAGWPGPAPGRIDLRGADLTGWTIGGASAGRPLDLRGADLSGAVLSTTRWRWVDLSGARLGGASLLRAELEEVTAAGLDLGGAVIAGSWCRRCRLPGLRAAGIVARDAWFVDCALEPAALGEHFPREGALTRSPARSLPSIDAAGATVALNVGHASSVAACAFSPDGARLLSTSYDRTLKLWDAASGNCLLTLSGHSSSVLACAFSPDGARILSASADRTLKLWDVASGNCLLTLSGHSATVNACAFSPDGAHILSASQDRTLKLWDAASGNCLLTLSGHSAYVSDCAFSRDGARILSASYDFSLKLWDAISGECLLSLSGHTSSVSDCAFSPDGARILSASSDKTLKLWNADSGNCLLSLSGHSDSVNACAFSPDGARLLSASHDHTLKLWDAASGNCLLSLSGQSDSVNACAFSPDGARLLSASTDGTLKLWDAASGNCLLSLSGHSASVRACAFSPDGARILSASLDSTLRLWDAASGNCLLSLSGHSAYVLACAFSPDGARLLSASTDGTLKLWDAASGNCLLTLSGHSSSVDACAFSPDGARILSASPDSTLKLWDAASGNCLLSLSGHSSWVKACAFSPDGARILSASDDNTLKLWDATSGNCLLTLSGHSSSVLACAFSPDGASLLSASDDNTLKVWDALSGALLMTLLHGPDGESASLSGDGREVLRASPGAWRFLALRFTDPATGRVRLVPHDHLSPAV